MTDADRAGWRGMAPPDLAGVERVADAVHPGHKEDAAVFAERLALYPEGCLVLEDGRGIQGYAVSHPWLFGWPPALNTRLERLPAQADTFYIHDLALLPSARGRELGTQAVARLVHQAERAGMASLSLIRVGRSARFWQRRGFHVAGQEVVRANLSTYGADAALMVRMLRPLPHPGP